MPIYNCSICGTCPDEQKSHHTKHLKTKKHKIEKRVLELELEKMTDKERMEKHGKTDIAAIVASAETVVSENTENELQETFAGDFNITNGDSLKEHIHSIHNYLRNHGGGYGLGALKIFNIFYGIKKLGEHGLNEMIGLSKEYWFSNLLKISEEMTDEDFHHHIVDGLLNELYDKPLLKGFLFYEIPKNIKSDVFRYLIKEINDITRIEDESNVLLSGKVYEYFVGRDESAISELGAYFTNRILVDFTIDKIKPQLDSDGNVPSMIDMFGGSGGFTTGYVNYMKKQHPDIVWKSNVNNIFHYDINEDVLKAAALEIFCLTGQLPNMENIAYKNSFKTEFAERPKYILTNPPYGGDKNNKSQAQLKRDILKKHIMSSPELKEKHSKQLKFVLSEERKEKKVKDKNKVSIETCSELIIDYAKIHKLTGNDKESCSLILLMAMLAEGGTCAGVLKEGVMFDKKYKALRKCLIENFNVREVVSIPADQFENTTTKTSLVIFDNTEKKTSEIKFSKLDVMKYTENKIEERNGCLVLTEMAGDISGCQEVAVSTATIQDVRQNPIYSFNGKDYNQTEIVCGDDYELVEMKDLCKIRLGTRITKKNNIEGEIPVYGGGDITFYTSEPNRNINTLIVSRYAMSKTCVRIIDTPFYLNDSGLSLHCHDNEKQEFINYLMTCDYVQQYIYENMTFGSIQRNINMDNFKKMKISVPKNPEKILHWVDKISQPYNEKNEKQTRIQELEKTIQERIQFICDNEDCEEVELGSVCKFIKGKKRNTTEGKSTGLYPLFSSSLQVDNWCDTYDYDIGCIIINTINGSGKFNLQQSDKFCVTSNTLVFNTKDKNTTKYIYYYGLTNIKIISDLANGSTKKKMGKSELSKFKIKLPKNKKLIDYLNPMFQEIDEHQQAVKNADELYKKYIQELSNEAIPKP
jgi:type I restriction-modification system DNA methylase subunit/restriction endonuclease S subunit